MPTDEGGFLPLCISMFIYDTNMYWNKPFFIMQCSERSGNPESGREGETRPRVGGCERVHSEPGKTGGAGSDDCRGWKVCHLLPPVNTNVTNRRRASELHWAYTGNNLKFFCIRNKILKFYMCTHCTTIYTTIEKCNACKIIVTLTNFRKMFFFYNSRFTHNYNFLLICIWWFTQCRLLFFLFQVAEAVWGSPG